MGRLEQLRSLSGDERRYLARALFCLPVTSFLLRFFGFQRTLAFYERGSAPAAEIPVTSHDLDTAGMAARMINVAANHGLYRARCLQKSLVLVKFLRARDIPCKLVLGARRRGEEFGAHAWVECEGVVINDEPDVVHRYQAFRDSSGLRNRAN